MTASDPPHDPPAPAVAELAPADGLQTPQAGPEDAAPSLRPSGLADGADAGGAARAGPPVPAPASSIPDPPRPDPQRDIARAAATGPLGPVWEELADRAADYAVRARGNGTRRTYKSAWAHFSAWCRSMDREPLGGDPELVAMYVVRRADDGLTVSSIRVALAAIRTAHLLAGVPLDLSQPRFRLTMEGVVRSRGVRPTRQAAPAVPAVLETMLAGLPCPGAPLAIRNRAMLLLGFGAALRRSELVALRLGDVQIVPGRGLTVLVRRSKTDQHGRGQQVAIWANPATPLTCPAASLERWLALRDSAPDVASCFSAEGRSALPLFCRMSKAGRLSGIALSDKAVARLVKTAAEAAGLDPERYSGHSLRAGLATAAGDQGAALTDLMRQTRHKSTEVALGYLRPADLWRNNVTERVFARQHDAPD